MTGGSTTYSFSVYTLSCIRWSPTDSKWKAACGLEDRSSSSHIICKCYQTSTLTAVIRNNSVRLEKTVFEEFELEAQASYIILGSVTAIFFLYCIFLVWFSVTTAEKVREKIIYFLSDVPSSYRYGYVLIVKTGNKSNAGTTSNVTIKMYGSRSESQEHVLNYPDPEKKLLQKNEEDWFFIGTEFYLGNIEKIDIWFDSLGYRPAWFCSEIEVFDVQQKRYWLFQINKWFEILKTEKIVYTAYPVKSSNIKGKQAIASGIMKKITNSFRGAHMWDLIRYEGQAITRMKRLHIVYSIFLTIYCMGVYLYGCPRLNNSDSLSYTSYYKIDKYVVLITIGCFTLTFVIHFPIVWFFRYPIDNILGKYQKVLKKYPINTNFLCWFFLITNIIVSMTLLIIFGFWVPYVTGLLWLTSITVSLLIYIFVMENIMRLIINFTTNQQMRVQQVFEQIRSSFGTVEKQRSRLYKIFGSVLLRPFFDHLYKPLDPHKIKELQYWASLRETLWEILEDLIMITIYVTLLYLVILMDKDVMTVFSHKEVEGLIVGTHSRTFHLEDVYNRKEMENYINQTLIFSMQSLQWYGKYVAYNPGMTIDNANKYLGVARLRQHRTFNVSCETDLANRSNCHPTYFWHSERNNFSEGWMSDKLSNKFVRLDTVWKHVSEWNDGTVKYVGTFALYPGGGYIAALGRTIQNSIINLNYIFRHRWIDDLSRCIFLEFLLYNPNANLFSSVRIKFEISATGYIKHKLNVHTAMLLFVKEETGVALWIILASFIIMLNILIVKFAHRLIRKRRFFLRDIWPIVDIFIIVMSFTCLGLYIARSKVVSKFLLRIEKAKHNEFVNYFHLMYTEKTLTILAAILVFLATLRLWKLMRFMQMVKVVERTLLLSASPLVCLFLYQVLFILACAFYGFLKYGDHSYDFKDIFNTISNLFIVSLNLYRNFNFKAVTGLGYIFYSIYMLTLLGVYTLYIAVITISYTRAKLYYSNEEDYNVADYVKEQCQYYGALIKIKLRKFRLRGGRGEDSFERKVYPKADELRYTKCVTIPTNKMNGMAFATKCIVRNLKQGRKEEISDHDVDVIKKTIVNLFRKDTNNKEIFFISNIKDEKVKFVDDRVMLKIEKTVEVILSLNGDISVYERRRKLYRKIVDSHKQKMIEFDDTLNMLLTAINAVNFDE